MPRTARMERHTQETQIVLELNLDGSGRADLSTGVGFFDHMLTLLAGHSLIDLTVKANGDLNVDAHHTVEDVGIVLGEAFGLALGSKSGIRRYGHFTLPMDETLATSAVDFSGRPYLVYRVTFPSPTVGAFDLELVREFWQGFANASRCNLHLLLHYGENGHHIAEAVFKAAARAIRMAVEPDPRQSGIPSTKGVL
ncbi:MAG: imidazoleglycerol-phosphate dehydratase HisB [Planctomycetaceae bacterium]|nr:imidazoleglycerol-phosphate dehydratase HisB [Planctomycetaceae bacterium]